MASSRKRGRSVQKKRDPDVKDRLVQTRVPERLEHVLKAEAKKRRLTVSHLIRNVLEDTLELVDTVVQGAGDIVDAAGSVAEHIRRDAGKVAGSARSVVRRDDADEDANDDEEDGDEEDDARPTMPTGSAKARRGEPATGSSRSASSARDAAPAAAPASVQVLAWNRVVVNLPVRCDRCDDAIERGAEAYLGLTATPGAPPVWRCARCVDLLSSGKD